MAAEPKPDDHAPLEHLTGTGKFSLDKLIHEQLRLGILSALSVNPSLSFSELKEVLGSTDGNLSIHARKLEEAGLIAVKKSFQGRTPRTDYRLTRKGKHALASYLEHMEALIRVAKRGVQE